MKKARFALPTALVLALVLVAAACTPRPGLGPVADRPYLPLGHEGRWFTDAAGRVVTLRGMNFVQKWAPSTPEAVGFDADDAALIANSGFNAIRLGVPLEFVMPDPGRVDRTYLDSIARTVRVLGRRGIYVLLDFHQDGYGPATHGNGMPAWATITDGVPNPDAPFPLYYVQNPAIQRAFDNFWANRAGPDGVPLQTHYAEAMRAVAQRFVASPNVIGYEAMNEPWPGSSWQSCLTGCPDLEQRLLAPFHARMTAAVRSVDRRRPVYVEPFVLFNFGTADTSLPGRGSPNVLSTHVYATTPALNAAVMDRTVAAGVRDAAPFLVTEWGDSNDPAFLDRFENDFDARLVPWMYWSYNGHVVADSTKPLVAPNLDPTALTALSRPYAQVVDGTPSAMRFDGGTGTFDLAFSTTHPDGRRGSGRLQSVIVVPKLRYPTGYTVVATGADVSSRPCAPAVTVRNARGATAVTVRIVPAATCG